MRISNFLVPGALCPPVMAAKSPDHPIFGMHHSTVVPENFDPDNPAGPVESS